MPPRLACLQNSLADVVTLKDCDLPSLRGVSAEAGQLNLDAVDAVDAVYEKDENEDEGNLDAN